MKNLYARLYAGLLSFLERHQPGVGGMKLPNAVIVSSASWGPDGRVLREAGNSTNPDRAAKTRMSDRVELEQFFNAALGVPRSSVPWKSSSERADRTTR